MEALFAEHKFDRWCTWRRRPACYCCRTPGVHRQQCRSFTNILEGCRHGGVGAPGVCVQPQRVRRQHEDAVLRARQHRPSGQHVRGHEEGQRADGAHLQPPVRAADDRAALSSPSTALGPAGHGACSCSRRPSWKAGRSTCSTMAAWRDFTTSTTSPKAWCACSTARGGRPGLRFGARSRIRRSHAPLSRLQHRRNSDPVELMDFIEAIEQALGQQARKNFPADAGRRRRRPSPTSRVGAVDRFQAGHAGARRGRGTSCSGIGAISGLNPTNADTKKMTTIAVIGLHTWVCRWPWSSARSSIRWAWTWRPTR